MKETPYLVIRANRGMIRDAFIDAETDGKVIGIRQIKMDDNGAVLPEQTKIIRLTSPEMDAVRAFWEKHNQK